MEKERIILWFSPSDWSAFTMKCSNRAEVKAAPEPDKGKWESTEWDAPSLEHTLSETHTHLDMSSLRHTLTETHLTITDSQCDMS